MRGGAKRGRVVRCGGAKWVRGVATDLAWK